MDTTANWALFRRKDMVPAQVAERDMEFICGNRIIKCKKGDYICKCSDGEVMTIRKETFENLYEQVRSA